MTEPRAIAEHVEEVVPGVWRWTLHDERIDYESDAHAVAGETGVVLIDPLPLRPEALAGLGPVEAVCLTAACHQRSSWRLRGELGAEVYAPEGARTLEQEPDVWYRDGDVLPGGLRAIRTPGPEQAHYAFLLERGSGVLFCPDLIEHAGDELEFVPAEYHDDPAETRRSVRQLLELPFTVLCFDHGVPITDDPHAALRELLGPEAGEEP